MYEYLGNNLLQMAILASTFFGSSASRWLQRNSTEDACLT